MLLVIWFVNIHVHATFSALGMGDGKHLGQSVAKVEIFSTSIELFLKRTQLKDELDVITTVQAQRTNQKLQWNELKPGKINLCGAKQTNH